MENNNLPIVFEDSIDFSEIKFDNNSYPISENLIKRQVIGLRPSHKNGVQIYSELKNKKYISHNYGHSGEGWTLLFSTIDLSINNFLKFLEEKNRKLNKQDVITIIGTGCIGLMTAIKLYNLGYTNLKIVGETYDDTASFVAGGLIDMMHDYKGEQLNKMNDLFEKTFLEYKRICNDKENLFFNSVREIKYYRDNSPDHVGLGYLAKKGVTSSRKIILKFKNKKNEIQNSMELFQIKTFAVVPQLFMDEMFNFLKSKNIPIEKKLIKNFDEIKSEFIFNCTGFGSYVLNNDTDMYPTCGHAIYLNDVGLSKYNYILLIENMKNVLGADDKMEGSLYFMPKSAGFLGGTFMKNYYGGDEKLNKEMWKGIIERAKFVFNGIKPDGKNIMVPKF